MGKHNNLNMILQVLKKHKKCDYDKNVELDGNTVRHFLTNDEGNPYYYNEDTNTSLNYVNDDNQNSGVSVNNVNLHNPANVKKTC